MKEVWITPMCCPCGETAGFTKYGYLKDSEPGKSEIKCNECKVLLARIEVK